MYHWGWGAYKDCSNDDPKFRLNISSENNDFGFKFSKNHFFSLFPQLNVLGSKFDLDVKSKTIAIHKFQRSRLTFQPRSLVLESHQYLKFI